MIRELYVNLVQNVNCKDEISREAQEEIVNLLREEQRNMDSEEFGRYRDKAFRIASAAEESGFVRGFKYAVRLFAECIRE